MHLIFIALGLFCTPAGDCVQAISQVPSVIACAQLINDNREPDGREGSDGNVYYLTQAECRVVEAPNK